MRICSLLLSASIFHLIVLDNLFVSAKVEVKMEHQNSSLKIGIITALKQNGLNVYLLDYSWSIRNKYCYASNFNNTKYIKEFGVDDKFPLMSTNTRGGFIKPYILRKYLSKFDWVMWMDVDTFFQNYTASLSPFLSTHSADIVVQDYKDARSFNNGVFFIKNSKNGLKFLDIWIDLIENYCGNYQWGYSDQNAWLEAILTTLNNTLTIEDENDNFYDGRCRYLYKCSNGTKCFDGQLENMGFHYQFRNIAPNNIIHFWSNNEDERSPYRAFGYFKYWNDKESVCKETDIICHAKYKSKYYKYISNKISDCKSE